MKIHFPIIYLKVFNYMCLWFTYIQVILPWGKVVFCNHRMYYNGILLGMKIKLGKQYEYIISEVLELFKEENHEGERGEVTRGESSGECGMHRPGGMVAAPRSHARVQKKVGSSDSLRE